MAFEMADLIGDFIREFLKYKKLEKFRLIKQYFMRER